MTAEEYKTSYSKETLIDLKSTTEQLLTLYRRLGNTDKVEENQNTISKIKEAIKLKDLDSLSTKLSEDEKSLISAFKTTALGREGLLNDAFFSGAGRKALDSLMLRGIVHEIKHFKTYGWLPNHTHYGLVDEEYPKTDEEWSGFRDSGYSNKMSFRDYLGELNNGNIKWTSEKITDFINKEVEAEFKKKFETETYWINFITFSGIARLKELITEDRSSEDVFRTILVEHIAIDRFEPEDPKILDKTWFDEVINDSIKFKSKKI